jgi:hypothetical protein
MVPASGEPIIHRTQRQVLERGFQDVLVTCSPERARQYVLPSVRVITPPPRTGDVRENSVVWVYQELVLYDRATVFLFADTYYTDEFMDRLAQDRDMDFLVYGRSNRNEPYQSVDSEHFAILLSPSAAKIYLQHLESVFPEFLRWVQVGKTVPAGLELYAHYRLYEARKAHGVPNPYSYRVEWSDLTDDFDTPADWDLKHKHFPDIFARPCPT